MSGAGIVIDTSDLGALQQRLDRLYLELKDRRQLMDEIGATAESQTRRRISEEKASPEGEPWPELDPDYAARKAKKSGGGLLEFAGDLLDSLGFEAGADQVEVGTNLIYGATQQEGDEDRGIKARRYLGISRENREDLEDLVEDFIRRLFE